MENESQPRPEIQRPVVDITMARRLLKELYGLEAARVSELDSFTDRNFEILTDLPVAVGSGGAREQYNHFILKVYNPKDSSDGNRVELAVRTMEYLWSKGYCCPWPVPNVHQKLMKLKRISHADARERNTVQSREGGPGPVMVVLLTYVPGQMLNSLAPAPSAVLFDVGRHLANFHLMLKHGSGCNKSDRNLQRLVKDFEDFNRSRPSTYCSGEWSLEKLPTQRHLLALVDNLDLRRDVETGMNMFEQHVVPVLPMFRRGLIHGDFNDQNILVGKKKSDSSDHSIEYAVSGIIDFGEVAYTCIIFDVAIVMAEVKMMRANDSFETAAHVLAGYTSLEEIPELEKEALYHLVLARYAQHIVLSLEAREAVPDNDFIMASYGQCCSQLKMLLSMPKHDADSRWKL